MIGQPRALPVTFSPACGETIGSHLHRLAAANRLKIGTLTAMLGLRRHCRRDDDNFADWGDQSLARLSAVTGRSRTSLAHAMPMLRHWLASHPPTDDALAMPRHPACRLCAARHSGGLVIRSSMRSACVCRKHQRWLRSLDQHDLRPLPEVLHANKRHRRLRGVGIALAYDQAQQQTRNWFTADNQPELRERWLQRLNALDEDPYGDPHRPSLERIDIATYPETVVLTTLHASPYWRQRDEPDRLAEAGRRLGARLRKTAT